MFCTVLLTECSCPHATCDCEQTILIIDACVSRKKCGKDCIPISSSYNSSRYRSQHPAGMLAGSTPSQTADRLVG